MATDTMTEREYAKMYEPPGETVSVDSATARYAGQWILMRVTKFNERQDPVAGRIVGTWSPGKQSERAISRKFGRLAQSPETRAEPYYLFEACLPGDQQEPQQATGDLIARVVAVIGEHRARRR